MFLCFHRDSRPTITMKSTTEACVLQHRCDPGTIDLELLCTSLHPDYLPMEFPQLLFTLVYLHPRPDAQTIAHPMCHIDKTTFYRALPSSSSVTVITASLPGYLKAMSNLYSAQPHGEFL